MPAWGVNCLASRFDEAWTLPDPLIDASSVEISVCLSIDADDRVSV